MIKRAAVVLCIIALVLALVPVNTAIADSDQVLLVYSDKNVMETIADLIKACGKTPVPIDLVAYQSDMIDSYEYIVLQDTTVFHDAISSGKRIVCIGEEFDVIPSVQIETVNRKMHASLEVYNNTQSIIIDQGLKYIVDYRGEAVGSIAFEGKEFPMGVMTERIMYAPYLNPDDISVFGVAKMLNVYFNKVDRGKMYIMIDEVYPFDDIEMLQTIADRFYENGMPFVMSIMPVYNNTEYPSFERFSEALRYVQSKSGSFIMHESLVSNNELVGEELEPRLKRANAAFADSGVHIFEETIFPYEVSMNMLASIKPQKELFISLPIDTVIKFEVFEDYDELNGAIDTLNKKWLQIGDYRRNFTQQLFRYEQQKTDGEFVYREKEERSFAFLVDRGNQLLTVIVFICGIIILGLIVIGYRLYRGKFLK